MISACERVSRDVQLAHNTVGDEVQSLIEHDLLEAAERTAHCDVLRRHHRLADVRHDGGLGRPVGIAQPSAGSPPLHKIRRTGLTTDHHVAEVRKALGRNCSERRSSDKTMRDTLGFEEVRQLVTAVDRARRNHHGRSGTESQQVFENRGVETRGREVQCSRILGRTEPRTLFGSKRFQSTMRDRHPLGESGGTRSVDHVCGIVGPDRVHPMDVGDGAHGQPCKSATELSVVDCYPGNRIRQTMKFGNDREPQYGAGIVQHEANTFTRIGRIHRHECRAGFGHRQHRDNRFDRTRQTQRHTVFRTDAAVDQDSGQLRGTLVEVAIGQLVFEKRESHAVGVCACRTVEQLGQGARRSTKVTADRPHRGSLVVGQDVDVADDYCRICGDGFQDARESQTEAAYRLGVEQVGGKCERHRDSGRCIRLVEGFDSRHSEIEAADVGRVLVSAGDQLERHLYNRRIRRYISHRKRLHHLLEPYLSVRLRITVDLDDAAQERRERRLQIDATPDGDDVRVGSRGSTDYHVRSTGQSAHHKREARM